MSQENSLIRLEEELGFLERKLDGLSDALLSQQGQIDSLEAMIQRQNNKIAELEAALSQGSAPLPAEDKPPHY
ncbi:SlyX family protein [Desulfovibrio sp. OttesenSCG-928-C14]|nr:SlyX family protein [Desulfovibrio sp. OttesenSCG-928-C14]